MASSRSLPPSLEKLPAEVRQTLSGFLDDLGATFRTELESVVLYGSAARGDYLSDRSNLNVLLVLAAMDPTILTRYAAIHRRWSREGIVVPLFMTREELSASPTVHPLEYTEMHESHIVLAGEDPFGHEPIDLDRLRLECGQEISGNLLRLRQRFIEGGGQTEATAILLRLSITSLLAALRGLLRVARRPTGDTTAATIERVAAELDLDLSAFTEAWSVKNGRSSPGSVEMLRLLQRYMASLSALADRIGRTGA